ncbi:MAG: type I methionyl aminopeptidase [Candidatus Auribacterota bacterium]|nr:type I methionyl aminopeptidase [Candidatus Auribacterota bacterium]
MIPIKTPEQIKKISYSGKILSKLFKILENNIKPGITTEVLNEIAEKYLEKMGLKPAFKGYRGFPAALCVSVNEEVVHGIPSKRALEEGDIVSIDMGAIHEGFFSDAARTYPVGQISTLKQKLIAVTKKSLDIAISNMTETNKLFDISHSIEEYVENNGFSVVRDFVGHGIGEKIHEDPQIPNFGVPDTGPQLKVGMVFAIEPMVNTGTYEVEVLSDHWTVVTKDKMPSAHFEDTVAITDKGPVILTR